MHLESICNYFDFSYNLKTFYKALLKKWTVKRLNMRYGLYEKNDYVHYSKDELIEEIIKAKQFNFT